VGSYDVAVVRENEQGTLNQWLDKEGYQQIDNGEELLSIVVDQFLSRRRFWALQVPVPLLCSGGGRGGLPSLDPWHVAAQRVTQIDGGLVDRDVLHGSIQIELVAV
jgi:hypothetical protein